MAFSCIYQFMMNVVFVRFKKLFPIFFSYEHYLSVSIYGNDKMERTKTGILLEIWL